MSKRITELPDNGSDDSRDAELSESFHSSIAAARHQLAINERTRTLTRQLAKDWSSYTKARRDDEPTGASPLSTLKVEALASVAALADFHCSMSHQSVANDMEDVGHGWAVDEGFLQAAFTLIFNVDTESF
jgi:hypothetical protein